MSIPINEILLDDLHNFIEGCKLKTNYIKFTKDNVALIYEFHKFFQFPMKRARLVFGDDGYCFVHLFIEDAIKNDWLEFAMETMMKYVDLRDDIIHILKDYVEDGIYAYFCDNLTPKQNAICQKYFDVEKIARDHLERCAKYGDIGRPEFRSGIKPCKHRIEQCNEILEAIKEARINHTL